MENLQHLDTERVGDRYRDVDLLDSLRIAELMNEADMSVAAAVQAELPSIARVADLVAHSLGSGGRLIYVGAGTSGRIADMDAAECQPTFGTGKASIIVVRAPKEDDHEAAATAMHELDLSTTDVVIGIAASGRTPFVVEALRSAQQRGARTVGISCSGGSLLAATADIGIEVVTGPEVVAGSTRLKAGTAQKMTLNMITTIAMIRLGRTYGNLMVWMAPVNSKMTDRAIRMTASAADCSTEVAASALSAANGEIAVAVVSLCRGVDIETAREMLDANGGRVRSCLEASQP